MTIADRTPKPTCAPPEVGNIPQALRERAQWVTWRYVWSEGKEKGKWTKVLCDPKHVVRRNASSTNPATWGTFEAATRAYARGGYDGVGFVLAADDPFCVLDLDHIADMAAAEVEIRAFGSYAEWSPSGEGAHIWILSRLSDGAAGHKRGDFEAYTSGRFMTVTGRRIEGTPATIEVAQEELDAFCARHFAPRQKSHKPGIHAGKNQRILADDELLVRMRHQPGVRGARFCALFDRGDFSGYASQSEADAALCNDLAYACGPAGEARVAALFRASALYREKADRDDYLTYTIALAYNGRTAYLGDSALGRAQAHTERQSNEANETRRKPGNHAEENHKIQDQDRGLEILRNTYQGRIRKLEERLKRDRELRARRDLTAEEKLTILATWDLADEKGCQAESEAESKPMPVYLPEIGKRCGRTQTNKETGEVEGSGQTAGKHLRDLRTYGILNYASHEDAEGRPHSYVTFSPATTRPAEWVVPPRTGRGGARPGAGRPRKCLKCGSSNLVERTTIETECLDCHDVLHDRGPDRVVNAEESTAHESGMHAEENQTLPGDALWGAAAETAAAEANWTPPSSVDVPDSVFASPPLINSASDSGKRADQSRTGLKHRVERAEAADSSADGEPDVEDWDEDGWKPVGRECLQSPTGYHQYSMLRVAGPTSPLACTHCEAPQEGATPAAEAVEIPPADVAPHKCPNPNCDSTRSEWWDEGDERGFHCYRCGALIERVASKVPA